MALWLREKQFLLTASSALVEAKNLLTRSNFQLGEHASKLLFAKCEMYPGSVQRINELDNFCEQFAAKRAGVSPG